MNKMKTQQIVLASRPVGNATLDNFRFENTDLPDIQSGEVLLEGIYYSVDPYMRGRMNDAKSYTPPFQIGQPIEGGVVAKVAANMTERADFFRQIFRQKPRSGEFGNSVKSYRSDPTRRLRPLDVR